MTDENNELFFKMDETSIIPIPSVIELNDYIDSLANCEYRYKTSDDVFDPAAPFSYAITVKTE